MALTYCLMKETEQCLENLKRAIQLDKYFKILAQNEENFEVLRKNKMNFSIVYFKKWRLLPGLIIRISECHDSVNVLSILQERYH